MRPWVVDARSLVAQADLRTRGRSAGWPSNPTWAYGTPGHRSVQDRRRARQLTGACPCAVSDTRVKNRCARIASPSSVLCARRSDGACPCPGRPPSLTARQSLSTAHGTWATPAKARRVSAPASGLKRLNDTMRRNDPSCRSSYPSRAADADLDVLVEHTRRRPGRGAMSRASSSVARRRYPAGPASRCAPNACTSRPLHPRLARVQAGRPARRPAPAHDVPNARPRGRPGQGPRRRLALNDDARAARAARHQRVRRVRPNIASYTERTRMNHDHRPPRPTGSVTHPLRRVADPVELGWRDQSRTGLLDATCGLRVSTRVAARAAGGGAERCQKHRHRRFGRCLGRPAREGMNGQGG